MVNLASDWLCHFLLLCNRCTIFGEILQETPGLWPGLIVATKLSNQTSCRQGHLLKLHAFHRHVLFSAQSIHVFVLSSIAALSWRLCLCSYYGRERVELPSCRKKIFGTVEERWFLLNFPAPAQSYGENLHHACVLLR